METRIIFNVTGEDLSFKNVQTTSSIEKVEVLSIDVVSDDITNDSTHVYLAWKDNRINDGNRTKIPLPLKNKSRDYHHAVCVYEKQSKHSDPMKTKKFEYMLLHPTTKTEITTTQFCIMFKIYFNTSGPMINHKSERYRNVMNVT